MSMFDTCFFVEVDGGIRHDTPWGSLILPVKISPKFACFATYIAWRGYIEKSCLKASALRFVEAHPEWFSVQTSGFRYIEWIGPALIGPRKGECG